MSKVPVSVCVIKGYHPIISEVLLLKNEDGLFQMKYLYIEEF